MRTRRLRARLAAAAAFFVYLIAVGCAGESEGRPDLAGQSAGSSQSHKPHSPVEPPARAAEEDPEPAERPMKVGDHVRPWRVAERANSEPLELDDLRGQVVLVRFSRPTSHRTGSAAGGSFTGG